MTIDAVLLLLTNDSKEPDRPFYKLTIELSLQICSRVKVRGDIQEVAAN